MRLALKFAAALTAGIALVLAVQSWLHVRELSRLQEREIRDDVSILGRTLSTALGDLWSVAGPGHAREFVRRADARREQTSLRLLEDAPEELPPRGIFAPPRDARDPWQIEARFPVRSAGVTVAELRVTRSLPNERNYFASMLALHLATTTAAVVITGGIALLLSSLLISQPIRELSRLAHRVADGDFTLRAEPRPRDELGKLGQELDAMTERLALSDRRVREERRARTTALEQLRHADRLSTVGKLASSMAHELGTPLNVVSGRAAMIATDDEVPAAARENAEIIAQQSKRMAGIIRELLDFAGRKPLDRRAASVREVMEHAASLMEPMCDDRGVTLEVLGSRDAVAEIDRGKTLQVLTNLIMNAMHAMPEGGPIALEVTRQHVTDPPDRHASRGDFVRIDVRDRGVGIPDDRQKDIFQPFFTTKMQGRGTGLGLSVCHGIVREHGGFVEVKSELGRGSCFSIYLPEKEES